MTMVISEPEQYAICMPMILISYIFLSYFFCYKYQT